MKLNYRGAELEASAVLGTPGEFQMELELDDFVVDWDGTFKPIDKLSYSKTAVSDAIRDKCEEIRQRLASGKRKQSISLPDRPVEQVLVKIINVAVFGTINE